MTSCVTKMAIIGYGQTRFASSSVPDPLFLLPKNMSIPPYLVPKRDIVSFPDPPPPFRQFYLDRGAEEGSGNIAIPFLYQGGGVTDE